MSQSHAHAQSSAHAQHAVPDEPGWSLLRLSAGARLGLACVIAGVIWVATLLVIL